MLLDELIQAEQITDQDRAARTGELASALGQGTTSQRRYLVVATNDGVYLRDLDPRPDYPGAAIPDGLRSWAVVRHRGIGTGGGTGSDPAVWVVAGAVEILLDGNDSQSSRAASEFDAAFRGKSLPYAGIWPEGCESCGAVGWRDGTKVVGEVRSEGGRRWAARFRDVQQSAGPGWTGECGHPVREGSNLVGFLGRLRPSNPEQLPMNDD